MMCTMADDLSLTHLRAAEQILESNRWDRHSVSVVWHMIRIAHLAEHTIEYEVHRPLGWTWAGFRVMYNTLVDGVSEPAKLAEILGVSRPTVTSVLNRLERDGLVSRAPSPVDGKRVEVRLTETGRQAVLTALPVQVATEERLLSVLAPEKRRQLSELLAELFSRLDEAGSHQVS